MISEGTAPQTGARDQAGALWRYFSKPERRGMLVWSVVAVAIAVPEIWGTFGNPWFYSISTTIGHLEDLWSGVRGIVVALIAVAAVHAVVNRPDLGEGPLRRQGARGGRTVSRTAYGRLTIKGAVRELPDKVTIPYLAGSAIIVGLAGWLAGIPSGDQFWRSYVIYGGITVFFVIIPNAIAYFWGREFSFTTLFATVHSLERSRTFVTMIIMAGLAVLTFHLALYPWPDIRLSH